MTACQMLVQSLSKTPLAASDPISALTTNLPNYLPGTREKTDLVCAYFADLIASVLKGKR